MPPITTRTSLNFSSGNLDFYPNWAKRHRQLWSVPQELQQALEAKAEATAAAEAEAAALRARLHMAAAFEVRAAGAERQVGALGAQLEEVMLSHDAAVQSKDRALAQVLKFANFFKQRTSSNL